MKKIKIALNTKSVNDTIKYLLDLKNQLPTIRQEFLEKVAKWIVEKANEYISNSDIGSSVKDDIKKGWRYENTENGIKIINVSQKAVFVEFGVGIVGQSEPHPNANGEGYEYNLDSPYKDRKGTGTWLFKSRLDDLDIPQNRADFIRDEDFYVVITQGTKGVWYAYNAIVDAQMELQKANKGKIGELWEEVIERYVK